MQEAVKIGAAAAGGYLLGRTKKAKAAIGLAMWLAGRRRPADLARDQTVKLLSSPQVLDLVAQLRGPLLTAGKQAALSVVEGQAGKLSDNLQRRTEKLGGSVTKAGSDVSETGLKTARRLSARRRGEPLEDEAEYSDEYEDEYVEDEGDEEGAEAEEAEEYEDEYVEDEGDEEGAEPEEAEEYEDEYVEDEGDEEGAEPEEYSDEYEDEDAEGEGEDAETEEAAEEQPKPRRRSARRSSSTDAPAGRGRRSTRGQQTRRGTSTRQRTGRPARRSA